MISDCKILGIDDTQDIAAIKSAFRRRVKELHPDSASGGDDPLRTHALFVEVCNAYRRLLGQAPVAPERRPSPRPVAKDRAVAPHADPAYAFYKTGMKHFMKIHPSQWNLDTQRMLNTRIAGNEEDQPIIKARVMELVRLFPQAYYYFSIVAHEYPESEWAFDAREKMAKIEERIGMYRRIIESFSSWNADKKDAIRQYQERYDRHKANREALRRDKRGSS